nr:MAG TPA: hypothetical protein [Crassvirales sp.]DAR58524.1 MAG TPA: hypothetical protein [Crassvirales sp.]
MKWLKQCLIKMLEIILKVMMLIYIVVVLIVWIINILMRDYKVRKYENTIK